MKKKYHDTAGSAVTVGTFDGVHRGHLEVLGKLKEYSLLHGLRPLAITFDRHPLEIIAPGKAPHMLQTRAERDELIRSAGVDVEEVAFTRELCSLTAGEWMKILHDRYGARGLIAGYDNTFGRDGRNLSPDDYLQLGEETGITVVIASELPGICSTYIRRALAEGDVIHASEMLGRDYSLSGTVVDGRHLGRELGFPTANLDISPRLMLPKTGVYAARLDGMPAVVNIGDNPTVDKGNPVTVEAHVIGFDGDLYGKEVRLSFVERIRDEKKFDSLEALKSQIASDRQTGEKILSERETGRGGDRE
ncbi:riboflavin biosynthesis protein RibF [bacterium]|nr:riboflavin biosynthesis protein RibF [bacterium]